MRIYIPICGEERVVKNSLSHQYMLLMNGDGWKKLKFIKLGMVYIGQTIGLKIKEDN